MHVRPATLTCLHLLSCIGAWHYLWHLARRQDGAQTDPCIALGSLDKAEWKGYRKHLWSGAALVGSLLVPMPSLSQGSVSLPEPELEPLLLPLLPSPPEFSLLLLPLSPFPADTPDHHYSGSCVPKVSHKEGLPRHATCKIEVSYQE